MHGSLLRLEKKLDHLYMKITALVNSSINFIIFVLSLSRGLTNTTVNITKINKNFECDRLLQKHYICFLEKNVLLYGIFLSQSYDGVIHR